MIIKGVIDEETRRGKKIGVLFNTIYGMRVTKVWIGDKRRPLFAYPTEYD